LVLLSGPGSRWKPLLLRMINLSARSRENELLDGDDIPFADIRRNMQELNTINTLLGGHAITIDGIQQLTGTNSSQLVICEIGCGGGDNLHAIETFCQKKYISATYIGIDIKSECIAYAKNQYPDLKAEWITNDYKQVTFENKPTIIFSSLFCHHFYDDRLVEMLTWMRRNSAVGFFINDLERNMLAYYSIKILAGLFSRSYLVKNDAPLSVARGFKKDEWKVLFQNAGITNYSIQWKWAFRYLIVCRHEQK
jgi:2-polyprenyl-3-methyl-5-hydroxy-6-metoxy-1,4-benzoquinol methylase